VSAQEGRENVEKRAQEINERLKAEGEAAVDGIIEDLKRYHENGNWDKFFEEDILDYQLIVSPDKKEILGFSILLTMGGPFMEFLCERNTGEILYYFGDIEIRKSVDSEICDDIIEFLEEISP
jgi:hypothetical protein